MLFLNGGAVPRMNEEVKMVIEISGININNHHAVKEIASIAGFAASIDVVNETTNLIDLGDEDHWLSAQINDRDVERMISLFVVNGFGVKKV